MKKFVYASAKEVETFLKSNLDKIAYIKPTGVFKDNGAPFYNFDLKQVYQCIEYVPWKKFTLEFPIKGQPLIPQTPLMRELIMKTLGSAVFR